MDYFSITTATGNEIGRTYPQLHCLTQPHAHSLSAWNFPDFKPKLRFELNRSSKLTDVLSQASIGAHGFIVNDKVRDVLEKHRLMDHRYHAVQVIKDGTEIAYHYLHLCEPGLSDQLDYRRSTFYETKYNSRVSPIEIRSMDHYHALKALDKEAKFGVKLECIHLSGSFNRDLDLFLFLPLCRKVFVSGKLKAALAQLKVTGIEIVRADEFESTDQ